MKFPATFTPEDGKIVVRFRDIPEAITQGDNEADAMEMAEDVLISSMDFYFEDLRQVPLPSPPVLGERLVSLPQGLQQQVLEHNKMLATKIDTAI
ncbi:type II toxin-antitoxin system HicB family antitoxin [Rugamonas sp. A1-17]|nr:type II toxin-antitoxin system HicB family antitoxin [Rugamonas sp. A1-17]